MKILDSPELARDAVLRQWRTKDPANDGRFLIGVVTTGIYCLPSCRARAPKDENVRFLADEDAARRAGLRACKRCRPDHFYRRYDADRERIERLADDVRARPQDFAGAPDMRAAAALGATKLGELFRRHYHTTPAGYLHRARLAAAGEALLSSQRRVLDVALDVGFDSSSAFHEGFQTQFAMSPGAYRKLAASSEFTLTPPKGFRREDAMRIFERSADSRCERVDGTRAVKALVVDGKPLRVELEFARDRIQVAVRSRRRVSKRAVAEAHAATMRMLGLASDPAPFERRMLRTKGMARLIRGRRGLRIPLTSDAYEGLVWVIVGQQVNLAFASTCRARLIELCGSDAGDDFLAHPTPDRVARLDYDDLTPLQFSRRKAEYLIDVSRRIVAGELDLEELRTAPAGRVDETLGAIRGLGPWSIQYLQMRSFGMDDCVPVGDVALEAALQRFFRLDARPTKDETVELLEPFAPHRSLASFHFWRSLGDPDE